MQKLLTSKDADARHSTDAESKKLGLDPEQPCTPSDLKLSDKLKKPGSWHPAAWLVACVIVVVGGWWKFHGARPSTPPPAPKSISVRVAQAKIHPVPEVIEVVGKVVSSASVGVRPQIGGILKKILIKDGDMVTAGQPLFEIDDAALKVALAQSQANYRRDRALAENTASIVARLQPLAAMKYATARDFEAARSANIAAQATAEATRLQIEQAKIQLGQISIASPMTGRTGAVLVKPGDLLSLTSTNPLVVINAISPVDIAFAVPQQKIEALRPAVAAGSVVAEARNSRTDKIIATGEIVFIDNAVGDTSGTISVKARFANADGTLLPGEFFAVRVIIKTDPTAVTIPEQALQQGQAGPFVYTVLDGKAKVEVLKIARILDGQAVVAKGLAGGETVVVNVPINLRDGSVVVPSAEATQSPVGQPATGVQP